MGNFMQEYSRNINSNGDLGGNKTETGIFRHVNMRQRVNF